MQDKQLNITNDTDPFKLFCQWLQKATLVENGEANAMVLATSSAKGKVNSRVVLLKKHSPQSFVFFTNYSSQKAQEINKNPYAAILFYWQKLGRQVRISGTVTRTTSEEADEYFATRVQKAQIGAWSSKQSQTLGSREYLEEKTKILEQKFAGKNIPRPEFWGGFSIKPQRYEFWQAANSSRLHDRFICEKNNSNKFAWQRLFP